MRRSRAIDNLKRGQRRHHAKQRGIPRSRGEATEGWTFADFARLVGEHSRTLRHYLEVGVLPRPPFRGTATRYGREQLLVVLAVRRLQSTEKLTLDEIRRRLATLKPAELEALATEHLAPGAVATALGIHFAPPPERPETRSSPSAAGALSALSAPGAFDIVDAPSAVNEPGTARWVHVELALGLELHVRDDASPTVLALAERVKETCWKGR